jgi:hypothetical protein
MSEVTPMGGPTRRNRLDGASVTGGPRICASRADPQISTLIPYITTGDAPPVTVPAPAGTDPGGAWGVRRAPTALCSRWARSQTRPAQGPTRCSGGAVLRRVRSSLSTRTRLIGASVPNPATAADHDEGTAKSCPPRFACRSALPGIWVRDPAQDSGRPGARLPRSLAPRGP